MSIEANLNTLRAASVSLNASAHNLANLNTRPFAKQRVVFEENAPNQGASATLQRIPPQPETENNVDIAEEMVGQLNVRRLSEAQVKAIQAQDELLGDVLDLRA